MDKNTQGGKKDCRAGLFLLFMIVGIIAIFAGYAWALSKNAEREMKIEKLINKK